MSWVKLSDTFAEDPRLEQAGPLALALHVAALCYCARQLTDGHLTRGTARRLLDLDDRDDPHDVAGRLVGAGMWAITDDGYRILEYLEDQPSRESVEALRAARATAGRAGGQRSGEARRSNSEAKSKQVASRVLEPRPVPSRPQPPPPSPSLPDAPTGAAPAAPATEQEEEERDDAEQHAPHALPSNDPEHDLTAVVLEHLPADLRLELPPTPARSPPPATTSQPPAGPSTTLSRLPPARGGKALVPGPSSRGRAASRPRPGRSRPASPTAAAPIDAPTERRTPPTGRAARNTTSAHGRPPRELLPLPRRLRRRPRTPRVRGREPGAAVLS